jgi:ABC-type multidrug transport system permease subunit
MPVTYLIEAMRYVVLGRGTAGEFRGALLALVGFAVGAILLAGVMVRRTS